MEELFQEPAATDVQRISVDQAWHYRIIPIPQTLHQGDGFYIDESIYSSAIQEELELFYGNQLKLERASSSWIQKQLATFYRKSDTVSTTNVLQYHAGSDDFLTKLILEAQSIRSSDIHVESYEEKCRVRIRIDGMLVERFTIEHQQYPALINRIKIMANLDISEKRLPQDGRISFQSGSEKFDIRVSVLPTMFGEKMVLRLLSQSATNIDIRHLGFEAKDLEAYLEGTKKKQGMILISGPTGSGKTTTLYATLKLLNKDTRNIVTIEDPIEYTLPGVNHVQLRENIGLNFASALRTFLRQDPNIIMVGEIRDTETANMAIRAAQTGHLVLSTIHTNSAWGTVFRLIDMGVPSFLLAGTLSTSVAQRLVRLLCPHCKTEAPFSHQMYPKGYIAPKALSVHYEAVGCEKCHFTGYKGRKAVYEVIPIDYDMAECIKNTIFDVKSILREKGIRTLSDNAFQLLESGQTSLDEVYPLFINF
jgi:general secretion pathway protein E/type IV pilus assembly protein PilB